MLACLNEIIASHTESGGDLDMESLGNNVVKAVDTTGLIGREDEIEAISGILGLICMVNKYPEEFYEDRDFWVSTHVAGEKIFKILIADLPEAIQEAMSDNPEVNVSRQFIKDPSSIIKDPVCR